MISFENPSLLWGITGLAVAIAIHLLSRKPAKITFAGSIRHLEGSASKQFKSIRLNEWLLLALRILLLTVFCLIISGPSILTNIKDRRWVLIEKNLHDNPSISKTIDSLKDHNYELRSLEAGFPKVSNPIENNARLSYWALSASLSEQPVDDVIIFYQQRAEGFRGERRKIPAWQHWIPVTSDTIFSFPINATKIGDSIHVRIGKTGNRSTTFETAKLPIFKTEKYFHDDKDSIVIRSPDTIRVSIHTSPGFEHDAQILSATFQVLEKISQVKFVTTQNDSSSRGDWIMWLSKQPLKKSGYKSSVVFEEHDREPLLRRLSSTQWILNHHVTVADALEQNFAVTLGKIMLPESRYETLISQKDQRVVQNDILTNGLMNESNPEHHARQKHNMVPSLMILLLLVLIAERLVAWKRNQ